MSYADTVGGSGGASSCVVNTSTSTTLGSCSSTDTSTGSSYGNLPLVNDGWPKPSWQTAAASLGVPADGVRDLPDVSFFAGDGTLDSASLICVSNDGATCTNISQTGSARDRRSRRDRRNLGCHAGNGRCNGPHQPESRRAAGQPQRGALHARRQADLRELHGRRRSTSSGCYFNDINQGTNSMPCAPTDRVVEGGATYDFSTGQWEETPQMYAVASPNCTVINSGDTVGTISGYSAVAGYDQATGLGSLNIANIVANWTAATVGTAAATVSISLGGVTLHHREPEPQRHRHGFRLGESRPPAMSRCRPAPTATAQRRSSPAEPRPSRFRPIPSQPTAPSR